jgi:adenosylcobinamide-GDP ribazoletransferase
LVLRAAFESFCFAVQFLTRVPVPSTSHMSQEQAMLRLKQSLIWFPLVGALIAALTSGFILASSFIVPKIIAILLGLIFEARLTGAFHEDAVADYCDAMGGGLTREDKLRIFKDSRIGSYGALGLMLCLSLRMALLFSIPDLFFAVALIASGGLGRWTILLVMARIAPIENRDGLAKDIGGQLSWTSVGASIIIALPLLAWAFIVVPVNTYAALIICIVFALFFAWNLKRQLGGSTGDCLGFACYVGQLLTLLCFSTHPWLFI